MLNCNSPEVRVSGLDILKPAWSEYLPSFTWGTLRWIYLAYSSQVILKISCGPQVVTRLAKARQAELGRETAPHQELSILTPTCGICHSLPHAPTVYHTYSHYTVQDPECEWSQVNIYTHMNQLSSLGISGQAEKCVWMKTSYRKNSKGSLAPYRDRESDMEVPPRYFWFTVARSQNKNKQLSKVG